MKKSILLMLLTLLTVTSALATVTQIGNGSESLYNVPLHAAQNYSWSHFILPGNAITNTGLITKLEFNVRNTLDGSFSSNQHVFMRLTNAITVTNAYTANPGSNGYTEVFDGSIEWNTNDWQGIELTTPFAYNGTSNLEIIWENRRGGWNPWSPVFTGTQSSQAAAYKSGEEFPETVGSMIGAYPNTRVTWQYSPIGLTCADPIPLNFPAINIMGNTANYGNNYSSNMITGGDIDARYLNGNDVVYQFTLAEPRVLNGTIITSASWMGAFILQQEPNATTPAPVILSKKSWDGNTITYNDDVLLSGTYYLIISSYPAPQSLDYTINLTATITTLQGSTCSNPIPLTFPATGITGNTADYGDDYEDAGVAASTNYLSGDDVVYKFTFTDPMVLNGTITADGTYMGVFILKNEPNSTSPAPVTHSVTASNSYSVQYSNTLIPAGTYYMIISTWTAPQSVNYTINLTATSPQGSTCANPILLTFPAVNVLGSTEGSGNNYHPNDVSPAYADLDSNDIVYQFTLNSPMLLNGTITGTSSTGISALFLQDEPNASNPPPTILRACAGMSYPLTYTNELFPAGTYYLIICANVWVTHLNYSINLTATPVPGVASNPSPVNGATGIFKSDNLTWQAASFADGYNVYLSADQTFAGISPVNQTGRNYAYSNLNYATTYYWKVIPYNAAGQPTGTIPVWSFTTCPNPFTDAEIVLDGTRVIDTCLPMEADRNYSMSQSIYYPEELNFHGAITSISYLYNLNSAWSETIEVFMKSTSKGVFANINDWELTDFTHVYSGSMAVNTTESVVTLNLDNPFYYHGTDNLMIMFFATESGSMSGNDDFYSYEVEGNRSLIKHSNSVNCYPNFPTSLESGELRKYLPVTGFNYHAMSEQPNFTVSVITLTFNNQIMGTESEPQSLNIANVGGNALGINSISITGANACEFNLDENYTYPVTLGALGKMSVSIAYAPTSEGEHTAQLEITDDQNRVVNTVELSGNALVPISSVTPAPNATGVSLEPNISFVACLLYSHYEIYFGNTPNLTTKIDEDLLIGSEVNCPIMKPLESYTDYYWKVVLYDVNSNTNVFNFTFRTEYSFAGSGTELDPYQIATLDDLIALSEDTTLWNKHFIQTANINASSTTDLNGEAGFSPIGNYDHIFTGSYNGANYTISNLYINRPSGNCIGLFGYTSGATMSNIGLINNHTLGNDRVGGLVGWSRNNSTITNCYVTGNVEGSIWIGGLAGLSTDGSTISNSYATGNVPGANYVGGLVGLSLNNSTITNCYATGAVNGHLSGVGGLVGSSAGRATIDNSYATGLVTGPTDITGGLVGVYGDNPGPTLNSFWDTETSGQTVSAGGEGKTTIEMTDANTYLAAGWDFATMWLTSLDINSGYPVFSDKYIKNVSPLNYSTFVSVTPTISFEVAEGYASYELYFGDEANPVTQIVANSPINNPITYTFTEPLESRTDYYWSVVLYGANRNGVSLSFTFKTEYLMDGSGSELDPYQIAILDDLIALSESETLWDKHFIQTANINASTTSGLNAGKGFNPIGYFDDEAQTGGFTGSYDGNHMTISNLSINRPEEGCIGLFGTANGADISNVCLLDNHIYGNNMVGSLVGNSFNESTINNCYATGSVNGEYYAGGLVGAFTSTTISKCYATGAVAGHTYIGGLVGMAFQSTTITNCYATGSVTGAHGVGGLAGIYGPDSTINNSYANGAVQSDAYAGGLVGLCDNGPGGEAPCTMSNSFWDTETSGQTTSSGGEGKTTIEMTNANTYLTAGWDFDNIWFASLNFNSGYPVFSDKYLRNISPLNNSTSVSIIPTISFEVAEVCSAYELYFGEEPNPVNQIIPNSPINNPVAYTFTEPLEPYTDYYWSVVLYGADRNELNLKFTFKTGAPFDGSGTEDEPYEIANFNDLLLVSQQETLWDKHFIQTANINASFTSELNEGAGFSPIGNDNVKFTGSYNGGIYTISNLYINRPETLNIGLFGSAQSANITNVGLLDVQVVGFGGTGGLAGWVRNCKISNNYVTGLVSSGSLSHTGGLIGAGSFNSTISNSYANCIVIGNHHAGGLVGFLDLSTINNCYATGAISGAGYNEEAMGGLVGTILQSTLNNSYATGSVTGKERIGGLVGSSTDASTVNNSYATGDVSGNTEVGGLVGFYERGSIITNSYATGFVSIRTARTGEPTGSVGGLVGAVDDHSDPYFGPCKAVNSFWNTETTGQATSISGEGKTTAEMQDPNTYITPEWDITEQEDILGEYIWKINAEKNDGYPYLVWAAANIEDDDNTLPVTLSSFMAVQTAANCAEITWTTESESSLVGYNIYRNVIKDEDTATRINRTLIGAENTSEGSSYSYLDDQVVGNTIYYYWLQVNEFDGSSTFHGPYQIRIEENFNNQGVVIPLKTTLRNVYPNPFNPATTVSFYMANSENVRINIYNIKGQLTSNLVNEPLAKGFHDIVWNGKNTKGQNCASGIYFFRMETSSEVQTIKGILMK